jgi:hypothetical protein
MSRWLRPSLLLAALAALVLGAALFFSTRPSLGPPTPLPVGAGDREIVWLYPATNASSWERFVAAVNLAARRLQDVQPGVAIQTGDAFPPQTTAVPEAVLTLHGGGRLLFRWYKLTSDWKTRDWIDALLTRRPPPLAVIAGSSSDAAREVAIQLDRAAAALPPAARPLLLLTQATADRVPPAGAEGSGFDDATPGDDPEETLGVPLNRLYSGRTFRYCFTNRQMARAVSRFLWSRDDLRPDADPLYMAQWEDDAYSLDLIAGFRRELRLAVAPAAAQDWTWLTTGLFQGGLPALQGGVFPLARAGAHGSSFRLARLPNSQRIDFSVGGFAEPNRPELQAARYLLEDMRRMEEEGLPPQKRPLLAVTGQSAPTRRFLRALARTAPRRRFVVVTGDAVPFNTVYRDRLAAWPIQDIPFPLIFFCHRNPIDEEAGFDPARAARETDELGGASRTGTEDMLLYDDIVESLALAAPHAADAVQLAERLGELEVHDGRLGRAGGGRSLFLPSGNRASGTGEHVVCLRPVIRDEQVLPEAIIEVWAWQTGEGGAPDWRRRGEPLHVSYDETPWTGG